MNPASHTMIVTIGREGNLHGSDLSLNRSLGFIGLNPLGKLKRDI